MTSEYQEVRSRIIAGGQAPVHDSAPDVPSLTLPPALQPPKTSPSPTTASTVRRGVKLSFTISPTFVSTLAQHVKHLSEARISQGFLHFHPSPIHRSANLEYSSQQYQDLTDLLRRIDVNLFNVHPSRLEIFLAALLSRLVHRSTLLSHTGTDHATTSRICHAIFNGSGIVELNLPNTPGYGKELDAVAAQGRRRLLGYVLRARESVVHHTNGLVYFLQKFICDGEELSQSLIKDTHRILARNHDPVDGIHSERFRGCYRDRMANQYSPKPIAPTISPTASGSHLIISFPAPKRRRSGEGDTDNGERTAASSPTLGQEIGSIDVAMARLILTYREQLILDRSKSNYQERTQSDPFALTAWLCTEFLHIRPFITGNEEMSRIILCGVLLKELGIVVAFGDGWEPAREEYIGVLERCEKQRVMTGGITTNDGEGASYAEFAALVAQKARDSLEEFVGMVGRS
ncbi:hypothetical protein Dda_2241 [Drechslerella dactyloides]|uniref:Fido domain-containing protein n=1 Tax=Drechslerella dactyloides TaxID=74499 RepID=A0AAD6J4I8_DREDA|nr:hypothetical protein Dda_2241 [Drechslerella dactyloides]